MFTPVHVVGVLNHTQIDQTASQEKTQTFIVAVYLINTILHFIVTVTFVMASSSAHQEQLT